MGNLREHDVHSAALIAQLGFIPGEVHYAAKSSGNTYGFLRDNRRITASRLHTNITDAEDAVTSDRNDVVILGPNYDSDLTAALVWDKHHTHLLGMSPTPYQPRNDIWQSGTFSPMITISGRGNIFKDFTIRHGTAETDYQGVLVSGRYNRFDNVYFYTPVDGDQADHASYRGLKITGHNNYFKGCKIGSSAVARGAKNYTLEIEGYENVFENCLIVTMIDVTSPHFLGMCIDAGTEGRVTVFKNCTFICYSVNLLTAMAYAINIGTYAGAVYFDPRCQFIGVTEIVSVANSARIYYPVVGATTTATDSMIALKGQGVTT